jgi:hypothetical protein
MINIAHFLVDGSISIEKYSPIEGRHTNRPHGPEIDSLLLAFRGLVKEFSKIARNLKNEL